MTIRKPRCSPGVPISGAHGRDERAEKSNFYQTVEFTYRLMKALTAG